MLTVVGNFRTCLVIRAFFSDVFAILVILIISYFSYYNSDFSTYSEQYKDFLKQFFLAQIDSFETGQIYHIIKGYPKKIILQLVHIYSFFFFTTVISNRHVG